MVRQKTGMWLCVQCLMMILQVSPEASSKDDSSCGVTFPEKQTPPSAAFSQDARHFAGRLFHHLATTQTSGKQESENLFFSPVSIYTALAMVHQGASGATKKQLTQLLFPKFSTEPEYHPEKAFVWLNDQLYNASSEDQKNHYIKCTAANALFVDDHYPIGQDFADTMQTCFQAEADSARFQTESAKERNRINQWVSDKTMGRIQNLLPTEAISDETKAVLVNALHFQAPWHYPFKDPTETGPFRDGEGQSVQVKMLTKRANRTQEAHSHYRDGQIQILGLAYKSGGVEMFLVLPAPHVPLKDLQEELGSKPEALLAKIDLARNTPTHFHLIQVPKFEASSSFSLKPQLEALGIDRAFSAKTAEFPNINPSFCLTDAFHKAFIKVDENGTEASAASGIIGGARMLPPEATEEFLADRPFLFLIQHKASRQILFMGRITAPTPDETNTEADD